MRRGLERGIYRRRVTEMPLIDGVVRRNFVNLRRSGTLCLRRINDGGQFAIVDIDLFAGIAGLCQRLGDHHRHRIADMADLTAGQRRMRRHFHRRAVLGMDHPATDQIADLVGCELGAVQNGEHARHARSLLAVDRFDGGVRVRRANEVSVSLARPIDVVGVVTLAGNETLVFLAAHRGANPGCGHAVLPLFCVDVLS